MYFNIVKHVVSKREDMLQCIVGRLAVRTAGGGCGSRSYLTCFTAVTTLPSHHIHIPPSPSPPLSALCLCSQCDPCSRQNVANWFVMLVDAT